MIIWRLKRWLSCLGFGLWLRYGEEKIHIAFRHKCGSEMVQLADFRHFGGEFQCFRCDAIVLAEEVTFRILLSEEIKKAKTNIIPHIVVV